MNEANWLSDEAWAMLDPHLPPNRPELLVDDCRVVSGILHVRYSGHVRPGCRDP